MPLQGKYWEPAAVKENRPIEKGDSITISVQRVYLRDLWEANTFRDFIYWPDYDKSGEIAMVVSATPLERSKPVEATTDGANQGRVIYYAERVRPKTHLPLSALPIYGPITYEGGPISFSLHLLDLDQKENSRTKAVVRTLASLGSVAYPPSSPILETLERVGTSLLDGDDDDLIFTHSGVFYPYSEVAGVHQSYLLPGYYVFIRPGSATAEWKYGKIPSIKWEELRLEASTGMLFNANGTPYADETYIVLAIDRGQDPVALDAAETLAAFSERITNADSNPNSVMTLGAGVVATIRCERQRLSALSLAREVANACINRRTQRPSALTRLANFLTRNDEATEADAVNCDGNMLRAEDQEDLIDLIRDATGISELNAQNLSDTLSSHPRCVRAIDSGLAPNE